MNSENRKISFGLVRNIPANAEETRTISFINSTFTKDRHGTVLNQDNWKLDNFRLNPIVGYAHNLSGGLLTDPNPDFVIGKDVHPHIERIAGKNALAGAVQFEPADINPLAEKIFRKVLFGSLNSSSVGFLPVGQGAYGTGDEARGQINETYYFAGQELLEWSVVNVGSNPDAGKRNNGSRMRDQSPAAINYAFRELYPWNGLKSSQIESMTVEDVLLMFDAKDLDIKEKDPLKVRRLLNDPKAKEDLIEFERLAFRKAHLKPVQSEAVTSTEQNKPIIKIQKMKKNFSLMKALYAFSGNRKFDDDTRQIIDQARNDHDASGLPIKDHAIYLPYEPRTVIDSTQPGSEVEVQYLAPSLANYLVFAKAGTQVLTGLKANQSLANISGITFLSKGENATSEDGAGTVSGVNLSPKRLTAFVDVSKLLFLQTGDGPSKLLFENIIAAYAAKIETIVLGIAAGSAIQAQGMFYKNTVGKDTKVNAVVPTLDNLLTLEGVLDAANAQSGQLAYITSGKGRRILQTATKDPGNTKFLLEDEKVNGFPLFFSNSVSDAVGADGLGSGLVFGKFNDLVLCPFGSLEIELDMITLAKEYKVRINVSGFYDCKGLRGTALTSDDESTDPDNYAVSFARIGIK